MLLDDLVYGCYSYDHWVSLIIKEQKTREIKSRCIAAWRLPLTIAMVEPGGPGGFNRIRAVVTITSTPKLSQGVEIQASLSPAPYGTR